MIPLIDGLFDIVNLLLLVRVLLSWISHNPHHPIIEWVYRFTDPILNPFRNIVPVTSGIDLSPMLAFMFLLILRRIIFSIL